MESLIIVAALTAAAYVVMRFLKKINKEKLEKENERQRQVERERNENKERKALKIFNASYAEICSYIEKESGKATVDSIIEYINKNYSDSSSEGREAIIRYLEISLLHEMADSVIGDYWVALERKHNQCIFVDEYGIERFDKWIKERRYFVEKVLLPKLEDRCMSLDSYKFPIGYLADSLSTNDHENLECWEEFVDDKISMQKGLAEIKMDIYKLEKELGMDPDLESSGLVERDVHAPDFDNSMSGLEYEKYVAGIVEDSGWQSIVTPSTGDHGADVIATDGIVRVAIQCKLYSSPVGNKSVQEVYSAKDYYECDFAMVVSNAEFTTAARQAASSLGVALLHHEDVAGLLDEISLEGTE